MILVPIELPKLLFGTGPQEIGSESLALGKDCKVDKVIFGKSVLGLAEYAKSTATI